MSAKIISLLFGVLFSLISILNMFWGNDAIFGVFLFFLSLIYYTPVQRWIQQKTRLIIPAFAKITAGIFIIWASLGVGELFDKIDLMLQSFKH